jgi:membrane protein implicated in regulation of membrane protease activity
MMNSVTWFVIWAVVGAAGALALLTAPTIGIFVLPATLVLGAVLARRGRKQQAGPGIVAGLGLPVFYVGYLNRGGPGTVCTALPGGAECNQETSPWPWLAAGLVLLIAGILMSLAAARRRQRAQARP